MKRRAIVLAFAALVVLTGASANATLINIEVTGTVQTVDAGIASEFSVGESFVTQITYDDATLGFSCLNCTNLPGAITSLSATFGGDYTATDDGGANNIFVGNSVGLGTPVGSWANSDTAEFNTGVTGANVGGNGASFFQMWLVDPSNTAFISNPPGLPSAANLPLFQEGAGLLSFGTAGSLWFDVSSARVVQPGVIPEPATMTLMGLGLAGLALRRRNKLA